jgi:hypothetical protein
MILFVGGAGLGCTEEGDTIIVNGLDCGLIRNDLILDWVVTFDTLPSASALSNCDGATPGGVTSVTVNGTPVTYFDVTVIASPSSSSFVVFADGPNLLSEELVASIEADSCLALVQVWQNPESGWVQCFGTFDRSNGTIPIFCDSMEFDSNADRIPDVACDLVDTLFADVLIP